MTTDRQTGMFLDLTDITMGPSAEIDLLNNNSNNKKSVKIKSYVQDLCVDMHKKERYKQII